MTDKGMRDLANRRFEMKTDSQRKAAAVAQEREAASREIRAKTERLKALRLAKEEAERAAQSAAPAEKSQGDEP